MIEAVGTLTNANHAASQAVQGQVEGHVETTPDVAQGKVNPTDDVEDRSNEPAFDEQQAGSQDTAKPGSSQGRIVDLLG